MSTATATDTVQTTAPATNGKPAKAAPTPELEKYGSGIMGALKPGAKGVILDVTFGDYGESSGGNTFLARTNGYVEIEGAPGVKMQIFVIKKPKKG